MQENLTTRDQILHLLRRKGSLTAQELGKELSISVSGIRQHTSALERASLITSRPRRKRVGRPGLEYALSPGSEDRFPKLYKEISKVLLEAAREIGGDELVGKLLNHRRSRIHEQFVADLEDVPAEERLSRIAEMQDAKGYLAHVERKDHCERLVQFNCPIHELSSDVPTFCESERLMYEKLLDKPVKIESCRALGASCCCFCIEGNGQA